MQTLVHENFKQKLYFECASYTSYFPMYKKRKRLVNIIMYCSCLKRHLDQDRMPLKPLPITRFIELEKICIIFMYFGINDFCMFPTKR